MVHLRCQYIQSRINHQTLQQWRTLLRNTQCQQWRLTNLSKQRLFSTHSKKNSSVYCFTKEELEDATNMLNSHMLKQDKQKRQLNKRISSQITAQINQHISSPNVLSLHTHLQKGNYTEVWILLDKIIHEKQSIPIAIAQQLLQVLRNEICQQQTKLKRHKGQLQNIYITRLEHILNHLSNQSKWEQQDIGIIIDLFGRLDRVDRAEVIYRNINQHSYQPLTTETCNKMLSMYFKRFKFCDATIQTKYISKMISIISNMPHRGCQPDITTYNWIIAAKMKLNDMKGAEKYFRDMTIKPDRTTYHLLLQGAFKHGSVSTHGYSADYWMECMVKDGLAPNKKSFKHIFNGLSDQLNHFSRMKDWDNMHRISKLVKQLFDIMPKLHYKPDIDHVNTLLKCFVISNNDTEIKNIIKSLDIPQVKKTNGCGGGCGGCGCQPKQQQKEQQQQIEKAITDHKLKNRKKNKKAFVLKYKPNIITFNMLIHYELKNLRLNNALKWYDDMMHMEIEPDTVTYGSFIGYYIKQNNIDEAIKYYDVMQHKGIPGNNHIYNMLLQGSSKQPSAQNKIMDRHRVLIVEDNVNQDIVSYNSQLSSLLSYCHHDISSVSRQIDYATAEWISNQFVNIYEQMLSHEVVPNERTYNIALDIYGKLSKHHILDTTISSIMESMSTTGLKPDLITYAINIRNAIYQQNPSLAESIFRSMLDDNIKPNNYIFSHLIIGYVKEGDLKKANQILNDMSEKPFYVKPTIYEYTPLIHGYAALGHLDQVYTLFRNMIDQDLKPDMTIYSILANTLIDNGSPKEAVQLLTGLLQQNTDNNNNNNSNNNNGNNQSSILEKAEKYPYLPFDDIAIGLLIKAHGVVGSQNANNNNNNSNNNNNNNNNNNIINTTTTTTTTYNNNNNNNSIQNNDINNILLSSLPSSTSSIASISHVKAIQHIYSTIHQPNDIINSIYLHALSRLKQPQCVWDAWQSMKHHSVIHYNILFSGLGENEQWYPKLKQVFDTMSCTPDGVTFDTMIMNAMKNNDIEYICHHLWPSDRRPRPYLHDDKDGYNLRQQQSSLMLIKTYFLTMKAMLSCQDYQKAKQVFLEFTSLPDHPASATLWKKEILALAHLNGFINH